MKLLLLTQDAPVYLAPFIDRWLELIRGRHDVVGAAVLKAHGPRRPLAALAERYTLYGPIAFARMLCYIAWNKGLAFLGRPYSVRNALRRHGVRILVEGDVNRPEFICRIGELGADVVVSIACPKILKAAILAAPPRGVINYHTALLPRYRGRMPLYWALFHGEQEVGMTVHEIDTGIDTGPIIVQDRVPVQPQDSLHDLYLKTTEAGPATLARALDRLAAGETSRLPNPADQGAYFGFPTPEQCREFRRRGRRFF